MSNRNPSCIEDLANELWLEIFDYLDWINLYSALYGINKRINQLLMNIQTLSIYSSYLINYLNTLYLCFTEFPIEKFQYIQHFQLIYDYPYNESLDIAKYFHSFPSLISLIIDANSDNYDRDTNQLITIIFHQHCHFLQYLHLQGNMFDKPLPINEHVCTFYFPSLVHIHVNKLPFYMGMQLLDQCIHLRSFSAIFYNYPSNDNVIALSNEMPERILLGLPKLTKLGLGEDNFYEKESSSTFLEFFLPICPNLRTFNFNIHFHDYSVNHDKILDPNWWEYILASHSYLKRIFLRLNWWIRDIRNDGFSKIRRFQASPFFTQFNVKIDYNTRSEFLRFKEYDLYIKN
ncbi:unnamed protein product [Adineta steineri]|uniref:F-box domain-containing protein n=1 Tax=Adineta steineri TaxID=433720 RepID=A0A814K813_9BILA|nr:unnamed protein product [Adineta steineri]CAF1048983.1 unnamed protein product [Adineta steineri]CAF4043186.1 unnamed protein product [Adineta steineri]CAF4100416.1 unnamed protein product [Adineta steineri]